MDILGLDHLVLTVADVERTSQFYGALGFLRRDHDGRTSLHAGNMKLNLHPDPSPIDPKAEHPTPGSADICLVVRGVVGATVEVLNTSGIDAEVGPVTRTGARGPMTSVYVRDPDKNLVELAHYAEGAEE
jgi:catechol 2,3-dioxygenase-like lactoylglutathione lyase family enzyme